ncbi:MAG: c-type cytochrome, partial [Bacteroidetes bacterium]|nr:c-type cytochrome [Bacteroidota bacterium]
FDGGAEWGGAAYDPQTGWLYVNANEMPWIYRSKKLKSLGGNRVMEIGKNIFGQQCVRCHGVNAQNLGINIPSLEDLNQRLSKKQVIDWIKKGKGEMPAFKQLSETEIEIISAFLLEMDSVDIPIEDIQTQNPAYVKYSLGSFGRFLDEKGFPAVKPPWGTLNAIDLNQGEIIWQVPLGEFEELTNQGFPITGTENYGGPVVTDGGLIFIAATKDEKFRAFDKKSGKMLWQTSLPTGGYATPATYMVGGKQYVVIACGGGKMGTKSGDSYVAFSLPD